MHLAYDHVPSETDATDGRISIEQPLTHGAALQAEVERLQRLNEVFPPSGDSYFSPYGDRTIVALQFPRFAESRQFGGGDSPGLPILATDYYGVPIYGPPRKPLRKITKHLKKAKDFGVILSQNYIYRKNVRDYGNFSKVFENGRPSQEILQDVAKMLVASAQMKASSSKSSSGGGVPNSLASLLNLDVLDGLSQGPGYDLPPIHPQRWDWDSKKRSKPIPSFVLVAIESRVKLSRKEPGTPGEELSLTNGSLLFPSPSNPNRLTHIPFILRQPGDVNSVFDGAGDESSSSYGSEGKLKGLIPQEKAHLLSFLQLAEGLHSDGHEDGKERLGRVRKMSDSLTRLRLPQTNQFMDDPLEEEESKARETYWLVTTTIGLRSVTPPPPKKLYPVVTLVPIVDSYREHPLNIIDVGGPLVPLLAPLPPPVILEERQPEFGEEFIAPTFLQQGHPAQLNYPELHYSTLPDQQEQQKQDRALPQVQDTYLSAVVSPPLANSGSSSSSYFYRTIKESK